MSDFNTAYIELKVEKIKLEKEISAMLDAFEEKYDGVYIKKINLDVSSNKVTIKLNFDA